MKKKASGEWVRMNWMLHSCSFFFDSIQFCHSFIRLVVFPINRLDLDSYRIVSNPSQTDLHWIKNLEMPGANVQNVIFSTMMSGRLNSCFFPLSFKLFECCFEVKFKIECVKLTKSNHRMLSGKKMMLIISDYLHFAYAFMVCWWQHSSLYW